MAAPLPQAGVLIINNWIMRGLSGFCLYRLIHLWFTGLALLLLLVTLTNQAAVFIVTKIVCAEDIAVLSKWKVCQVNSYQGYFL